MTAEHIARALGGHRSGRGWMACCPVHEADGKLHHLSLGVTERDGKVLVRCHGGCPQSEVVTALKARGLWPTPEGPAWTPEQRRAWAAERREIERDLPAARCWQRAASLLAEEKLYLLKSALFDPTAPAPDVDEIRRIEAVLAVLRHADGEALVTQYHSWRTRDPRVTAGLVRWTRCRERAEKKALLNYLEITAPVAEEAAA